jgi:hypothetical protein
VLSPAISLHRDDPRDRRWLVIRLRQSDLSLLPLLAIDAASFVPSYIELADGIATNRYEMIRLTAKLHPLCEMASKSPGVGIREPA